MVDRKDRGRGKRLTSKLARLLDLGLSVVLASFEVGMSSVSFMVLKDCCNGIVTW